MCRVVRANAFIEIIFIQKKLEYMHNIIMLINDCFCLEISYYVLYILDILNT